MLSWRSKILYPFLFYRWRFTAQTANRLHDRRPFDSTGRLHQAALHQLIIKLLSFYWPLVAETLMRNRNVLFKCSMMASFLCNVTVPGWTSPLGNTDSKCLRCCPFHIFHTKRLFILRPALNTRRPHWCADPWVTSLHLFIHWRKHIGNLMQHFGKYTVL